MKDLFGREISLREAMNLARKRPSVGYAAPPGSGPAGETCGSCEHLARVSLANTYLKCDLMRAHWTGGAGTDVKARAPACRKWERIEETT